LKRARNVLAQPLKLVARRTRLNRSGYAAR